MHVAPRGKRVGRLLMTILFLAGGIVILNFPRIGPRLRVGEIARRDYRARVSFQVPDHEATRRIANEAEEGAPKVFRMNADHLQDVPHALESCLVAVVEGRKHRNLDRWGVPYTKLQSVKKDIQREWVERIPEPVEAALKRAGTDGIMDGATLKQVRAHPSGIAVYTGGDPQKTRQRSTASIIGYPSALRRFLAAEFEEILRDRTPDVKEIFLDMITHAAKPTLTLDATATDEAKLAARKRVPVQYKRIAQGSIILRQGEPATREAMTEIELEEREFKAQGRIPRDREREAELLLRSILGAVGLTTFFLVGYMLLAFYASRFASEVLASNTRVFTIFTVSLVTLGAVRLLEQFGASLYWTPIVLAAMLLNVATGTTLALGTTALIAVLAGIVSDGGIALSVSLFVGGLAAVLGIIRLRRRTDLFKAGVVAGLVQGLVLWAIYLAGLRGEGPAGTWPIYESLAGLGSSVLAGSLLTGALPYVEKLFDVATELRLLEWTDQNQPLLRRLALEAPGTYHHSSMVSNMAEAAAERIGANALLARAGAYLHDVGKLCRPEYFIENNMGMPSLHENLSPTLSGLILTAHTKDGVEIARQYGVPTPLRRIVAEHHGTMVVEYFYNKALKEAGNPPKNVKESMFRYRGPKPRSPESAIVMAADAVESAARSLEKVSPSRIEKLVHGIVEKRLEDGQFDESKMNITDIRKVEISLVRSLTAVSHARIRYPST